MNSNPRRDRRWVAAIGLTLSLVAISLLLCVQLGYSGLEMAAVALLGVFAGLSWRFPVVGGLLYLALLTVWVVFIPRALGPVAFGYLVPLASLAYAGRTRAFIPLMLSLVAVLTSVSLRGDKAATETPVALVFFLVAAGAAYTAGRFIAFWGERVDRELRRQQERVAQERRQLARDLHDTIVYATTTMVMRTEDLRRRGDLPAEVDVELQKIADTGRSSTHNLRSMLSLLRQAGDMVPGSALADGTLEVHLQSNVDRLREAGFDANANITGDASAVPQELAEVIAAVAVEASSNIIKHGDRQVPCALLLEVGEHSCDLAVLNGVTEPQVQSEHEPMGLVGMRERVENVGGEFSAGRVGDSFVVEVKLVR